MARWSDREQTDHPTDWVAVAIVMGDASPWSCLAVRWSPLDLPGTVFGLGIDDALLVGFGPAFGAAAATLMRPGAASRTTSLLGRVPWAAWLALAAPIVTAGLFGMPRAAQPWLIGAFIASLHALADRRGRWRARRTRRGERPQDRFDDVERAIEDRVLVARRKIQAFQRPRLGDAAPPDPPDRPRLASVGCCPHLGRPAAPPAPAQTRPRRER